MNRSLFSSRKTCWETPDAFFAEQDARHGFTLDVCATAKNAKCGRFFTRKQDGLKQRWSGVCFMNPPYGRDIGRWVQKAQQEASAGHCRVVCLLPARTDTSWWHSHVIPHASEVVFLKGRLKFKGAKHSAPFPSVLVTFEQARTRRIAA